MQFCLLKQASWPCRDRGARTPRGSWSKGGSFPRKDKKANEKQSLLLTSTEQAPPSPRPLQSPALPPPAQPACLSLRRVPRSSSSPRTRLCPVRPRGAAKGRAGVEGGERFVAVNEPRGQLRGFLQAAFERQRLASVKLLSKEQNRTGVKVRGQERDGREAPAPGSANQFGEAPRSSWVRPDGEGQGRRRRSGPCRWTELPFRPHVL